MASILNSISPTVNYSRSVINKKNVLDPEGKSYLASDVTSESTRTNNGIGGTTTNIENMTTNYTDQYGRKLSDIFSGNQEDILKNLEKRKSLLSQGIGAGKSLLGGAVI